ncbi:thioredoxin-dependent thiol peroxidase [Shigella flexneri]
MNPLKAGDIAPKFSLPDQDGERVQFNRLQGQRVLVYFYPKTMTPAVPYRPAACAMTWISKKAGVLRCWGWAPTTREALPISRRCPEFTLLSDEDHQVCEQFGVSGGSHLWAKRPDGVHRISFLIDAEGKIEHVFDDFKTSNHHDVVLELS